VAIKVLAAVLPSRCLRFWYRITMASVLACSFFLFWPRATAAQGEGPRVYLFSPVGVNALSLTWMDLASNFNFSQTILVEDADIASDVLALNYNRFFSVGGRFAEIWVTGIWGSVEGDILVGSDPPPIVPFPPGSSISLPKESGVADPYFAMRVGLIGAPALELPEFMQHKPGFQLYALAGFSPPLGDYQGDRPVNLGTNRWALRLGLPMVIPLGSPASRTSLEIHPNVYIYTDNDDPYRSDLREQDPLFVIETHLTRNFTPKLWTGIDLRYRNGGETTTDGVSDDNRIGQLGGGVSLGYQVTRALQLQGSYGEILAKNDDSEGRMLRLRLIWVF
jgi:hypothetical protein